MGPRQKRGRTAASSAWLCEGHRLAQRVNRRGGLIIPGGTRPREWGTKVLTCCGELISATTPSASKTFPSSQNSSDADLVLETKVRYGEQEGSWCIEINGEGPNWGRGPKGRKFKDKFCDTQAKSFTRMGRSLGKRASSSFENSVNPY